MPLGSPVAVQTFPPLPPVDVNCTALYAVPTTPLDRDTGPVITRAAGLIVSARFTGNKGGAGIGYFELRIIVALGSLRLAFRSMSRQR
jgi:hypothetical protein